jgi:hypothetical protein
MTGAGHYREAEEALVAAAEAELASEVERYHLACAQVHATLALAAATGITAKYLGGES